IAVIAIVSVRPPPSITPVFGSAAEVAYPYPAQIAFTHRAAEMAFTHPPKMPTAHPAAEVASTTSTTATTATAACNRVGGNASASHRYGGNHDRDSVQHNLHSLVRGLRQRPVDDRSCVDTAVRMSLHHGRMRIAVHD